MDIHELVRRRSDLSTFVVHLTRDEEQQNAKAKLISILQEGRIEARNPFGQAVSLLTQHHEQERETQKCVCFTETPLEYTWLLTQNIENRQYKFEPFGIAMTKKLARDRGINPIWYVDITPGHDWLTGPLNSIITTERNNGSFADSNVAKIAPFIEQMGTGINSSTGKPYRKEFWWEREWRAVGDCELPEHYIVLAPESEFGDIEAATPGKTYRLIDPKWGLEQIIAHLAGFKKEDIEQPPKETPNVPAPSFASKSNGNPIQIPF